MNSAAKAPGRPAFGEFKQRRVFGSLDGLRALSIIGVVYHHATRTRIMFLSEAGAEGVTLFFGISGFLITTLLLRERHRTGSISLKDFYARRTLRIFPLYYAVLLAYVAIVFLSERDSNEGREFFSNLKYFLTYTSNWYVHLHGRVIFIFAWTLATEEQFYLVWPSVERFVGDRLRHAPAVLALLVVILRTLVGGHVLPLTQGTLLHTILMSTAPAICMGVALAHVLDSERGFLVAWRMLGQRATSAVLLVAVIVALLVEGPRLVPEGLMVLLVGACVVREDHWLGPILRTRVLGSIGKVSYGIYLLHMLHVNVVERVLLKANIDSPLVVFPLALLAAWGTALISYRYYESRFLKLKERFAR
jgi:peptidoglycan/LPS O-acetylase OafA/YrhL